MREFAIRRAKSTVVVVLALMSVACPSAMPAQSPQAQRVATCDGEASLRDQAGLWSTLLVIGDEPLPQTIPLSISLERDGCTLRAELRRPELAPIQARGLVRDERRVAASFPFLLGLGGFARGNGILVIDGTVEGDRWEAKFEHDGRRGDVTLLRGDLDHAIPILRGSAPPRAVE